MSKQFSKRTGQKTLIMTGQIAWQIRSAR